VTTLLEPAAGHARSRTATPVTITLIHPSTGTREWCTHSHALDDSNIYLDRGTRVCCRTCRRDYHRAAQQRYRDRHRDKVLEAQRRHRKEQPAREAAYQQRYRQRKGEAVLRAYRTAKQAEYRQRHPERVRASKAQYYQRNTEELKTKVRAAYNPDADRERHIRRELRRRNAVAAAGATFTIAEWVAMKVAYENRCAYCRQESPSLTRDHVVPLAVGGLRVAANIVPACRSCNSRKHTRTDWPAPYRPEVLVS
jgi:5-methylcytosine-specific restriction endonuclease McrA